MTTGAILLAAGFSRRFGDIKLNAVLPDGSTVLQQTARLLSDNINNVLVVTRPALLDANVLSKLTFSDEQIILCHDADQGMGHSLACAVRAIPVHWHACMVCLGDMPFLGASTLQQLQQNASSHEIIIPTFQGQRGHPVVFGRDFFAELSQSQGDTGGREVVRNHPDRVRLIELDDPGILQDIDTPEDIPAC